VFQRPLLSLRHDPREVILATRHAPRSLFATSDAHFFAWIEEKFLGQQFALAARRNHDPFFLRRRRFRHAAQDAERASILNLSCS